MSTETILAHHLGAFSEGVEAIMRDFTAESVLFTPSSAVAVEAV